MKLYHAITMYQILVCIIHRITYNKNEKCILILPDFIVDKYPQYMKLKDNYFFDDVFLFAYMEIPHIENGLTERLTEIYNRDIGIPLNAFDDFYIAGVHFYFSILLIENDLFFNAFEEAAYNMFNTDKLKINIETKFPMHAHIASKYKLITYENPYIKKVYVCKKNREVPVSQKRFVLRKELRSLNKKYIYEIMKCFNAEIITIKDNAVIVLTEQFYNLGIISEDMQKELYEILFAYINNYMGGVIYVKPHPDDKLNYLNNERVTGTLNAILPAELLPYQIKCRKMKIVTISSTAAIGLKSMRRKVYILKNNPVLKKMLAQKMEFNKVFEHS